MRREMPHPIRRRRERKDSEAWATVLTAIGDRLSARYGTYGSSYTVDLSAALAARGDVGATTGGTNE